MTYATINPVPHTRSSVTIVGAGGIGCAVGHTLARGGIDVEFVDVDASKIDAGNSHGVEVDGLGRQSARFTRFADWHPTGAGLILLCTKCYDNALVLARIPDQAILLPIQNGFDPKLEGRCRHEGIASFVSTCRPGAPRTAITRGGDLHVGGSQGPAERPPEVDMLVHVLQANAPFGVRSVEDIRPFKHTKLMYNAAISPLAAVTGMDNGQLLTVAAARGLFFAFLRENYAILKRAGITLGTIGPFHPATVNRILRTPLLGGLLAGRFARSLKGTYCSMSGDIESGRTEVDNFNGHLVRLAGDGPCPLNRAACSLVSTMARDRTTPAANYLDALKP